MEGDTIAVWAAGDRSSLVYSSAVSGGKAEIKDKLNALTADGKEADFAGALKEAASEVSRTPGDRIPYTMLITASAGGLQSALTGDSQGLLKWFRSEKYERWQVLIVGPGIAQKVREAAASYMRSGS
jgi:hypothetical protein